MRVAIIGSRGCKNLTASDVLAQLPENCSAIVSGGAQGVDALAREAAQLLGVPIIEFLPDYARYGRMAPLRRNTLIVERAELVLAFWDYSSKGTADTIARCIALGVPVRIVDLPE